MVSHASKRPQKPTRRLEKKLVFEHSKMSLGTIRENPWFGSVAISFWCGNSSTERVPGGIRGVRTDQIAVKTGRHLFGHPKWSRATSGGKPFLIQFAPLSQNCSTLRDNLLETFVLEQLWTHFGAIFGRAQNNPKRAETGGPATKSGGCTATSCTELSESGFGPSGTR